METFYIRRLNGGYEMFTGMAKAVVDAMLAARGVQYEYIDQATYDVATHIA